MKHVRYFAVLALFGLGFVPTVGAAAQDDVVHRRNGIIDRGKIVAYDAAGVRLLRSDTRRETLIPADQVERVEVKLHPQHLDADNLFEQRRYGAAAEKFDAALKAETRNWLRTRIATGLVASYVAAGDRLAAIDAFFEATDAMQGQINLAAAPIWWFPEPPSTALQQRGQELMQASNPLHQVIGASLLSGSDRAASARERLTILATYRDERVGQLARTQLWRWEVDNASADMVATWERQVMKLPADARAGPYFVIGLALRRLGRHEEAALTLFWPGLVYRSDPELSRRATMLAAQSLEAAGQTEEAKQLYEEVVARYRPSTEASAAQRRLDILKESVAR